MESYRISSREPARGDIGIEQMLAAIDRRYRLKGLFFSTAVDIIGRERYEDLRYDLSEPQHNARYLAFSDYPVVDHALLTHVAALLRFPGVDEREAHRRYAREDILRFSSSTLGRVTLSLVGDPAAALMHFPRVYQTITPGPWDVSAERLDEDGVRVHFGVCPPGEIYQVGQLESVVLHYGEHPETEVVRDGEEVTFTLRW